MTKKKVPRILWDFRLVEENELLSRAAHGHSSKSGYEILIRKTPNMSEYLDFDLYYVFFLLDRSKKHDVKNDT